MGHIVTAIRDVFFPWAKQKANFKDLDAYCYKVGVDFSFLTYAIHIAISKIANAISVSDFETYVKKKNTKGDNWWTFNVEPNLNQNKYKFWQDVIYKMVYDSNGALIIQTDEGHLVCVEDYQIEERDFYDNRYYDIALKGGAELKSKRLESNVLHLTLNNTKVREIILGVYDSYGKLISGSVENYNRGNAMKFVLKVGALFDQWATEIDPETGETQADLILDDVMKNRMQGLLSEESSVTPLEEGLELQEIVTSANTKSGAVTTRDITATFDDIMNLVADAFHIPRGLMKGDVADVEAMTQNFVTFCIDPLAKEIETEINRKLYKKDLVLQGTKLRVDTSSIKTKDPVQFASSAEALFRIGAYSMNDILQKLGEETIDEAWADERFVTKNYEGVNGVENGKDKDTLQGQE